MELNLINNILENNSLFMYERITFNKLGYKTPTDSTVLKNFSWMFDSPALFS